MENRILNITLPPRQNDGLPIGKKRDVHMKVDKYTTLAELKEKLKGFVGVEPTNFKLYRVYQNYEVMEVMERQEDTLISVPSKSKIDVRLCSPLRHGERNIKLYLLRVNYSELVEFMMESIVTKNITIKEFKKQIAEDAKKQGIECELKANKIRLRKKVWRTPGTVFLDHQLIDKDLHVYAGSEMFVEPLDSAEPKKHPTQLQVYVRRWRPSEYIVDPLQDVILDSVNPDELKRKISECSDILSDRVFIAKGVGSFPADKSILDVDISDLEQSPLIESLSQSPFFLRDDGGMVYYKDSTEKLTGEKLNEAIQSESTSGIPTWASSYSTTKGLVSASVLDETDSSVFEFFCPVSVTISDLHDAAYEEKSGYHIEGTFMLVWKKEDDSSSKVKEIELNSLSTATLSEMKMPVAPTKTYLVIRKRDEKRMVENLEELRTLQEREHKLQQNMIKSFERLQKAHQVMTKHFKDLQTQQEEEQKNHQETRRCFKDLQALHEEEQKNHQKTRRHFKDLQIQQEEEHQKTRRHFKDLQIQEEEEHQKTRRHFKDLQAQHKKEQNSHKETKRFFQDLQVQYEEKCKSHIETRKCFKDLQALRENEQRYHQEMRERFAELQTLRAKEQREHQEMKEHFGELQIQCVESAKKLQTQRLQLEGFESSWKISYKDIQTTNEELGRGGWGLISVGVFREQRVAVKQLYKVIMSESTLAVMNREINTMSKIRHPNLLLFVGASLNHPSGNPLIITEIMDTSLRQAYEKGKLTRKNTKLSVLRDTASGLNYLHCHHDEIIHRDVSSANVLLESRGPNKWRAKLSDFGSANIARDAFTQAPGAAVYSAPESIVTLVDTERKPQTTKMDVYSYGVLLCEVMTCTFPGIDKFRAMLQSVSSSSPPIGRLIQSCMKKNPLDRPTMKEAIQQIDRYIN